MTHWMCSLAEFMSVAVFGISGAAALGHAFGVRWMRHWIGQEGMAVNTSLCFLLASISTFLMSMTMRRMSRNGDLEASNAPKLVFGFGPPDVLALLFVVGGFGAMAMGKTSDVIGIMILIAGFYFGRTTIPAVRKTDDRKGSTGGGATSE